MQNINIKRVLNTPVAKIQNPYVSIVYSSEKEDVENTLV